MFCISDTICNFHVEMVEVICVCLMLRLQLQLYCQYLLWTIPVRFHVSGFSILLLFLELVVYIYAY